MNHKPNIMKRFILLLIGVFMLTVCYPAEVSAMDRDGPELTIINHETFKVDISLISQDLMAVDLKNVSNNHVMLIFNERFFVIDEKTIVDPYIDSVPIRSIHDNISKNITSTPKTSLKNLYMPRGKL